MRVLPVIVAEPAAEPVTLAQLAGQVRSDGGDGEPAMLMGYLIAARQHVERVLGFPVARRTVRATFYCWPDGCAGGWPVAQRSIEIGMPVMTVDAINHTAADGSTAAWTGFVARTSPGGVTSVRPAHGQDWPALGNDPVITLDATAGWERPPEAILTAIAKLAAYYHAERDGIGDPMSGVGRLPRDIAEMLAPWRWRLLA